MRTDVASPDRYIERISLTTGEVIGGDIVPGELLVRSHRDYHVVEAYAHFLVGVVAGKTEHEGFGHQIVEGLRHLSHDAIEWSAEHLGVEHRHAGAVADRLCGARAAEHFFRFKRPELTRMAAAVRLAALQDAARAQIAGLRGEDGALGLRVLLTGATGFVGKEILWQAVRDPEVVEVVALVRPKTIRDRHTKAVIGQLTPAQRGAHLLDQLGIIEPERRAKVTFVAGDIEQPGMGLDEADFDALAGRVTHLCHCAASVAFDAPYEASYAANVLGTLNALTLALRLQRAPGSPFVAHIGVETSYIHGRQRATPAHEDDVVFPRNFYNNYYELTKAMGAIETDRMMLEEGLRVVQLCPAIVIGDARTGNNRGDTKVVNAPINAFGRAQEALDAREGSIAERSKGWLLAHMALLFPGDGEAELNLIPVDWVAQGIVASFKAADAVGERVHLATDNRLTAQRMRDIVMEELGVSVRLTEPTMHRNLTLPVVSTLLAGLGQPKLASALQKLNGIFGGYSEPDQPIHEVGNDVQVLGMSPRRPHTENAFRMLCRHNKYVQHFGKVRTPDEIARRERVWSAFVDRVEVTCGKTPGAVPVGDFARAVLEHLDLDRFTLRGETPARV